MIVRIGDMDGYACPGLSHISNLVCCSCIRNDVKMFSPDESPCRRTYSNFHAPKMDAQLDAIPVHFGDAYHPCLKQIR